MREGRRGGHGGEKEEDTDQRQEKEKEEAAQVEAKVASEQGWGQRPGRKCSLSPGHDVRSALSSHSHQALAQPPGMSLKRDSGAWTGPRAACGLSGQEGDSICRNLCEENRGQRGEALERGSILTVELSGGTPLSRAQMVRL